jgi:hypothetical protein
MISSHITKIFIAIYFLPAWIASLMSWGESRTSEGFETAPGWFQLAKLCVQIGAILILFLPLKLRARPSLGAILVAFALVFSTFLVEPVLEADFILLKSSVQIGLLSVFLLVFKPSANFTFKDLRFLFFLFIIGFILQIVIYFGYGSMPSHSIRNVLVRFNGFTNDSLSTGILLVLLVPMAVTSVYRLMAVLVLITMSALTGSLFGFVAVLSLVLFYSAWRQLYQFIVTLILTLIITFILIYDRIISIFEIKLMSILTHMKIYLNLLSFDIGQPVYSCAEEFCESFIELSFHLSPVYSVLFYWLMYVFVARLFFSKKAKNDIVRDSLFLFSVTLFASTFVHPLPLIPFAIPLFLIFCILYTTKQEPHKFI